MLFNTTTFALFMLATVAAYFLLPHGARVWVLLAASYTFYMWAAPQFAVYLLGATLVSYICGILLEKQGRGRKAVLVTALLINLAVLFLFKYYNFFMETLAAVLAPLGVSFAAAPLTWAVPLGISFYTFQTVGYMVDVWRGTVQAERHFGVFALFVCFFPHIISGPIGRAGELIPQFREKHTFSVDNLKWGAERFLLGLFYKVVLADNLLSMVKIAFKNLNSYTGLAAVFVACAYGLQLYFDFAGYSSMAVGAAQVLGFRIRENFAAPYFSASITEFWSRWHMSLSSWLRDYVYIPLGGNRKGYARKLINLLLVFLVSGIWHGASVNYVVWGLAHGVVRAAEEIGRKALQGAKQLPRAAKAVVMTVRRGLVFLFGCYAFVLFRATDIEMAMKVYKNTFVSTPFAAVKDQLFRTFGAGYSGTRGYTLGMLAAFCLCVLFAFALDSVTYRRWKDSELAYDPLRLTGEWVRFAGILFMLVALVFLGRFGSSSFIYFDF